MSISSMLSTQWADYPRAHANRVNFVVHLATVPLFMAGTVALFGGLCTGSAASCLTGLSAMMAALAAQAWGHRLESHPPAPFTGPVNAFARIVFEQWLTFPRYVLYRIRRAR
ncbi:Mpo1-like protein [Castellaniella sp. GW247-6E4]|uniref:Mpo1-like protein n=1 Tax=Castellaniella sp. GW247-6E4 TaxID=3140380 RepID=UPI003314C7C8